MPPANKKENGEAALLEKIAAMSEPHRTIGERLHALIMKTAPSLQPRLWYGLPGYAKNGQVVCFFNTADIYMTFGLTEKAHHAVEAGATDQLMASAWFLTTLDEGTEAKIMEIVRKAAGI